jgi:ABC-type multidrug transport system ATPase subunit
MSRPFGIARKLIEKGTILTPSSRRERNNIGTEAIEENPTACRNIRTGHSFECAVKGFHCPTYNVVNYTTSEVIFLNEPTGTYNYILHTNPIQCNNEQVVSLCAEGYYCPTSTEIYPCPAGYYCSRGSDAPRECTWGLIGCPYSTMRTPLPGVLVVGFTFILCVILYIYYLIQQKDSNMRETRSRNISKQLVNIEKEHIANTRKFLELNELRRRSVNLSIHNGPGSISNMGLSSPHNIVSLRFVKEMDVASLSSGGGSRKSAYGGFPAAGSVGAGGGEGLSGEEKELLSPQYPHSFASDGSLGDSTSLPPVFPAAFSPPSNAHKHVTIAPRPPIIHQPTIAAPSPYGYKAFSPRTPVNLTHNNVQQSLPPPPHLAAIRRESSDPSVTSHSQLQHHHRQHGGSSGNLLKSLQSLQQLQIRNPESTALGLGSLTPGRNHSLPDSKANTPKNNPNYYKQFEFNQISKPVTISFDSLNLTLATKKQRVLTNIFGTFRPYEITALLGPSGAGKTSLLNLLRGRADYATCTGKILINGCETHSLSALTNNMAFVPQDDVVYEDLTVEDNIMYSAMLFNKRRLLTYQDLLPMVYKIEQMLSVEHIRYCKVGGVEKRGISGGQRKRVSIGMEIVKESALLFLDEPTSGLDSATSISVLHTLHELADLGVNIVATLHQPRYEILELIHSVMLLAPGGRIVYHGSPTNLRSYCSQFGYECPVTTNIADFVMDCLAGFILSSRDEPINQSQSKTVQEICDELCNFWQSHEQPEHQTRMDMELEKYANEIANEINEDYLYHSMSLMDKFRKKDKGRWWNEVQGYCHKFVATTIVSYSRQKKIYHETYRNICFTCLILLIGGFAGGFLESSVRIEDYGTPNVIAQTSFSQLIFGIFVGNASLALFANDEFNRKREETGGILLIPYFLGKIFSSFVEYTFYSLAFLSGYFSVIESNAHFIDYFTTFLLLHVAISAISNMMAVIVPRGVKNLTTLGLIVVLWLFGGVSLSLAFLSFDSSDLFSFLFLVSLSLVFASLHLLTFSFFLFLSYFSVAFLSFNHRQMNYQQHFLSLVQS